MTFLKDLFAAVILLSAVSLLCVGVYRINFAKHGVIVWILAGAWVVSAGVALGKRK